MKEIKEDTNRWRNNTTYLQNRNRLTDTGNKCG